MTKKENKINKMELKDALIKWVFELDGYGGGIGGVLYKIPWETSNDIELKYWQDVAFEKIDEAIGSNYTEDNTEWDIAKLLAFNGTSTYEKSLMSEIYNYRNKFDKFIDAKVEKIYSVYQECIDDFNKKYALNKKYYWELVCEGYTSKNECYYDTKEECYNAMRNAVNEKVLWNIEYTDFEEDAEEIDISINASRDKIEVKSYSGTYTWTIKEVN